MNVEGMNSGDLKRLSDTRRKRLRCASETILRNSAVRYSLFDTAELVAGCGSLFKPNPAIDTVDLIQIDTSTCGVSYKRRR
jgi:hypothetical protein